MLIKHWKCIEGVGVRHTGPRVFARLLCSSCLLQRDLKGAKTATHQTHGEQHIEKKKVMELATYITVNNSSWFLSGEWIPNLTVGRAWDTKMNASRMGAHCGKHSPMDDGGGLAFGACPQLVMSQQSFGNASLHCTEVPAALQSMLHSTGGIGPETPVLLAWRNVRFLSTPKSARLPCAG